MLQLAPSCLSLDVSARMGAAAASSCVQHRLNAADAKGRGLEGREPLHPVKKQPSSVLPKQIVYNVC
ncbi:hypothetical protein cyc_08985 [Cyclospora cayetanensis]|uniref:Uncharacterized protein n=1 Tax=Cyclospora cayetanensis TaxID=88456 RepID=A0A1D3D3V5_9EIME|nr:hypothetical protein cyc_08985 [Cyclospora cayetanensis]